MRRVIWLLALATTVHCSRNHEQAICQWKTVPMLQRSLEKEITAIDTAAIQTYIYPDGEVNLYKFVREPNIFCCGGFIGKVKTKGDTVFLSAEFQGFEAQSDLELLTDLGDSYQVFHFMLRQEDLPPHPVFSFQCIPYRTD